MASSSSIDSMGFALVDHTQSELLGTWKRSLCISGMEYLRREAWTGNMTGCIRVYSLTNATMRSIYSLVYLHNYNSDNKTCLRDHTIIINGKNAKNNMYIHNSHLGKYKLILFSLVMQYASQKLKQNAFTGVLNASIICICH